MDSNIEFKLNSYGYTLIKTLGEGGYGTTYLVKNSKGEQEAVKIMERIRFNKNEVNLLDKLKGSSKNIVNIIDWKEDNENYYMFMEYVPNSKDLDKVKDKSIKCVKKVVLGLIYALQYLHSHQISHQDIKPRNILVTDDCDSILIDFGLSCLVEKGSIKNYKPFDKEALLYLIKNKYSNEEFIQFSNEISKDLPKEINGSYNLITECMAPIQREDIEDNMMYLVELTQDPVIMSQNTPKKRVQKVKDFFKGIKLNSNFEEVLSENKLFGSYANYTKVRDMIEKISIDSSETCLDLIDYYLDLNKTQQKDVTAITSWFLDLIIKFKIPIEVYLNTLDLFYYFLKNISIENYFLLLVVIFDLVSHEYMLKIGEGINCQEINFINPIYPYAPPESMDKIRDPKKADIYALGISLGEWLTNYREYRLFDEKYFGDKLYHNYGGLFPKEWVKNNVLRKNIISDIKEDFPQSQFNEAEYEKYQPIIAEMIDDNPLRRPSLDYLKRWFTNLDDQSISQSITSLYSQKNDDKIVSFLADLSLGRNMEEEMAKDDIDYQTLLQSREFGGYLKQVLVEFATNLGLKQSGTKNQLVDRIIANYQ